MATENMDELLQQPALATPPGVISQFPNTYSTVFVAFYPYAVLATVIPGVILILRMYTKFRIIRKADWADGAITLAWPFFIALLVCGRLCIGAGGGAHQWNIRNADFITASYYFYVIEIVYGPCIFFVKAAILLQYISMFAPQKVVNPFIWWGARITIAATAIYYLISTFITSFACVPREAIWNPLIKNPRCLQNNLLIVITCVFNILSDLFILLLPAKAVWNLTIPTKKKVGIIFLFGFGTLACACNALVIYYVFQCSGPNADISYNLAWAGFFTFVEISFGMLVSSAFLLPRFFDAKGSRWVRSFVSQISRPFTDLTSRGSGSGNDSNNDSGNRSAAYHETNASHSHSHNQSNTGGKGMKSFGLSSFTKSKGGNLHSTASLPSTAYPSHPHPPPPPPKSQQSNYTSNKSSDGELEDGLAVEHIGLSFPASKLDDDDRYDGYSGYGHGNGNGNARYTP